MMVFRLLALALVAGCFVPSYEDCGITCSADVGCPDGLSCQAGRCAEAGNTCSDGIAGANRVFVTSSTHSGALGGLGGADAICQQRASEAGLGGTFVALLATGSTPAISRLDGARGWADMTNRPIADAADMFAAGTTFYPLQVDERGRRVPYAVAWVGARDVSCLGWTIGDPSASGSMLYATDAPTPDRMTSSCASTYSLVCAEATRTSPVRPAVTPGRTAFITPGTWTPGGGIASADAFCAAQAAAAHLSGTFRAFLGTGGASPEARFSATGAPFRRVDGVLLAATASAFLGDPAPLETFPIRADRRPVELPMWTGAVDQCASWTVTTGAGTTGLPMTTVKDGFRNFTSLACSTALPLLCVEP
jgi:hypothetical protein